MTGISVATTSALAADAARETASNGGNAVDCALAASLLTMNAEPSVCALAGGSYISIWKPGSEPVTIDGNVAVPGYGPAADDHGGVESVTMAYGGGITTLVGAGTVGVPGSLAAVEAAWKQYGDARWQDILAPSIRATRDGFPLSSACHYYLGYSGKVIYGRTEDGYRALYDGDKLREPGSTIVIPHLSDSLSLIAAEGARAFYEGDLATAIVRHCHDNGGRLVADDLKRYRAIERPALQTDIDEWRIATNPPPAVGGVVLSAMLSAFAQQTITAWDVAAVARLVDVQRACLGFRKRHLDLADDVGAHGARMLAEAKNGRLLSRWTSSSTVHTSAVDDTGLACAITASSGYGSGEMPSGTGLWLNNCLGELELNRRGLDAGPIGSRLPSNMAPSVARQGGRVIAVGSPGADRITTALHQFLVNLLQLDMPLADAVAHPRVHVDTSGEEDRLMAESGLPLPDGELPVSTFPDIGMYFGGVGVASFDESSGFEVAADPRREGGTVIVEA
ncbi:MAG: gamma-glutamyltransferase [Gammaproteobacteria bacterium]|nr:gamma-glutamyltransferase [Gammaproteobacteria bacterium]